MSSRNYEYAKGSSRSARDDSSTYRERSRYGGGSRQRSRSRSPRRRYSPEPKSKSYKSPEHSSRHNRDYIVSKESRDRRLSNEWESEEDIPAPPPPPRITKISIGFTKPKAPIKMNIGGSSKQGTVVAPKPTLASVFNTDDDDEPEEMPAEARMRMRNIGRETPTSAGPNSFGKTKQGFCDTKKVFEKNLKAALETAEKVPTPTMKLPQTIYKIKSP